MVRLFFVFLLVSATIHLLMVRMYDKVNISLGIKMATNKWLKSFTTSKQKQ